MKKATSWDEFIRGNLLSYGVVSGAILISQLGKPIYAYGELDHLQQGDLLQFKGLFRGFSDENPGAVYQQDFKIRMKSGQCVTYKAYRKSYCSIYATSNGTMDGLIVCNLPYGILICTYKQPIQPGEAIKRIEKFCDIMRA